MNNVVILLVSLAVVVVTLGVMWRLGTWPFAVREPFGHGGGSVGSVGSANVTGREPTPEPHQLNVMGRVIALITEASNLTNGVGVGRANVTLTAALVTALGAAKASSEFAAL